MNIREEKQYEMLQQLLPKLELSEVNKKIAAQYLEDRGQGDSSLLEQTEPQDFTKLQKEVWEQSLEYIADCQKKVKLELLERYTRFVASVGGSTAYYLLARSYYDYNMPVAYLTKVQKTAITAEAMVWINGLYCQGNLNDFYKIGEKNPDHLKQAMELCYAEADNAKILLAAFYLNVTAGEQGAKEVISFLVTSLKSSLPGIFTSPELNADQIDMLTEYIQNGDPKENIPTQLLNVFEKRMISDYLLGLLSGSAFLAISHAKELHNFLKLVVNIKWNTVLDNCLNMAKKEWFEQHSSIFEGMLPTQIKDYILWCAANGQGKILLKLVRDYPLETEQASKEASEQQSLVLMRQIKKGNPDLYSRLERELAVKVVNTLTQKCSIGRAEAQQYLLGEADADILYPFTASWKEQPLYDYQKYHTIDILEQSNPELFERQLILEALSGQGYYFANNYLNWGQGEDQFKKKVQQLFAIFEKYGIPVSELLETFHYIYNSYYSDNSKGKFLNVVVQILISHKEQIAEQLVNGAITSNAVGRHLCICFMNHFPDEYKENLLLAGSDSSKLVRQYLVEVYAAHKDWEEDIKIMLTSKKSQLREMSLEVLKKWGIEQYQKELSAALEIEKSKKLKKMLEASLGIESTEQAKVVTGMDLVAELLKGGKKKKLSWAYETPFHQVLFKDGTAVSEDYLRAILICYADMNIPGVNQQAKELASVLDQQDFCIYVSELFDKWLDAGAEAKKKWVLYAAAIHGDEVILPKLLHQIQQWPLHSRGAIAAEAVKAMALNSTPQALLSVDQISRKFKFKQVKAAAGEALEYAAKEMGISKQELEDQIVPNLGFDDALKQVFDYGERCFTVYLNAALELEVFDEKEKKMKNLPAPGKKDDPEKSAVSYERYKQLKKQLKTVVNNQKLRLDQALSAERLWTTEKWQQLFVKNPVMHQFAIGLVWGVYDEHDLTDTFRYMEDGSFNTVDEEEYELSEAASIGLVHPIELDQETLDAWREQLADYEIKQPIEQIDRKIYAMTEEEKSQNELTRFGGMLINDLSLTGKLQGLGWYKGSVQDAGGFYTFYREDGPIGVELEFSGSYVGGLGEEVTVYGVTFYQAGTVTRGSYVYDQIKAEHQYQLGDLSQRYFSEIIHQLERALASSKERVPYPACKQR